MKQNSDKVRESFVFYRSFFDAIVSLSAKEQLAIYNAIALYALDGIEPDIAKMSKTSRAMWALIKPQIYSNIKRYENGCKGAEHGAKGGAPKGNSNAEKNNPKTTPKGVNGNNPKTTPNENVNDNENVNENDNECVSKDAHTHTRTQEELEIERQYWLFGPWCEKHAPLSLSFAEPLTFAQFAWLYRNYGANRMKQCAADLHDKEAYKTHRNAMNCWKSWIKRINLAC